MSSVWSYVRDLDRAGFYAKTQNLTKPEMHKKLMKLFELVEFADHEIGGDYNWELSKRDIGLPSEAN